MLGQNSKVETSDQSWISTSKVIIPIVPQYVFFNHEKNMAAAVGKLCMAASVGKFV